jgi:hypothetical protein
VARQSADTSLLRSCGSRSRQGDGGRTENGREADFPHLSLQPGFLVTFRHRAFRLAQAERKRKSKRTSTSVKLAGNVLCHRRSRSSAVNESTGENRIVANALSLESLRNSGHATARTFA